MSDKAVTAHPAATIVLLRPAENGFEVLLLLRAKEIKFAGANWVFPGGRIELSDSSSDDRYTLEAAKVAAARECQEEAGLELSSESMIYYSHWTTPTSAKKRFATWFFLDVVTDDQPVQIDDGEIVEHQWIRPEQALNLHESGALKIMPPTYLTLLELAKHNDIDEALQFAANREVPQMLPISAKIEESFCSLYPGDIAYESADTSKEGPKHRIIFHTSGWEYINSLPD